MKIFEMKITKITKDRAKPTARRLSELYIYISFQESNEAEAVTSVFSTCRI